MSEEKGKKVRIRPLKHEVMDDATAERYWRALENAIRQTYCECIDGCSFEQMYRKAYKMVLRNQGAKLYSGLVETMTQQLQVIVLEVESAPDSAKFLLLLDWQWWRHTIALGLIRDILECMERSYVPKNGTAKVIELGLNLWRDIVIRSPKIKVRLFEALHDFINRERNGQVLHKYLSDTITFILSNLDPFVYHEDFERQFLVSAVNFYRLESLHFIRNGSCCDYLRRITRRWNEECRRAILCLRPVTWFKILMIVKKEMISDHVKVIVDMDNDGLVAMLVADRYTDLQLMYHLLRRARAGLPTMREAMFAYLRKSGSELVMEPTMQKDPIGLVQRLLDEKDKYDKVIRLAFFNDSTFQNALSSTFEHFMSLNPRCPEFISLFLAKKVCNGFKGMSDQEEETELDKVAILCSYLRDKDLFRYHYQRHLAKRLLIGGSLTDDLERRMAMKLKRGCGGQFTRKVEGMCNDMKISEDILGRFKEALSRSKAADVGNILSVRVLTTGLWPIQSDCTCILPTEILTMCDNFKAYYLSIHKGRRLNWLTKLGTADLNANFGNGRKHQLRVSTYQMCILMLFNTVDALSFNEIQRATEIPPEDLKQNLQSLACDSGPTVLRKESKNSHISETDVFHFNDGFSSNSYKVKIRTAARLIESGAEVQQSTRKLEGDRMPQIDAALIRIMKSRKVVDHNDLITEVTHCLRSSFLPGSQSIKRRIESLMEREFLERDPDNPKQYRYIA